MKRKRKDNRGETLVEVLASILIGALSIALLFTAVMASGRLDKRTQKVDDDFNKALDAAEAQAAAPAGIVPDSNVTVQGNSATATLPVTFYGDEGALSYALP